MYWLPLGTPSPEPGAGPGLIASSVAALAASTTLAQSVVIVNIATIKITPYIFLIFITSFSDSVFQWGNKNLFKIAACGLPSSLLDSGNSVKIWLKYGLVNC